MRVIALGSATKGRLRPSFFLLILWAVQGVPAQQPVYRCGQEYTNAPADPARCERLSPQAVTVIPGTRVQASGAPAPAAVALPRIEASGQRQRDDMARAIVLAELDKARQRHAALMQAYQQTQDRKADSKAQPTPEDATRKEQLQAAVDRVQRDIDSLQRELERRPAAAQP
jgi:hypothetical protein